ncbi:hypothetical protein [Flavobacterium sp.]|uniref:hypothetical protein n=1 Tax=Flavobacterium sp. TaxID=239 RepID=UPI002ED82013
MKTNITMAIILLLLVNNHLLGQVGVIGNNPSSDAVLDLNRNDGTSAKGLLLPNVALTSTILATPLTSHVAGMHIYNTASVGTGATAVSPGEYYNNGTLWVRVPVSAWALSGNANTNAAVNYLGTSDGNDLMIKTKNVEKIRITGTNGNILVGTTTVPTGGTNAELILNNGTKNGALQIKDGTQATGTVLTSDANGLATWKKPVGFGSLIGQWKLTGNNTVPPRPTIVTESGTSTIVSGDQIGLTALPNGVKVPEGNYMVYVTHDYNVNEFGLYQIVTTTGVVVYTCFYDTYLGGMAFYLKVPSGGYTLQTTFCSIDPLNSYFKTGTYTASLTQLITFLKI